MFMPIGFGLRLAWRFKLIVLAGLAGFGAGVLMILREEQRTWGIVPADLTRELAGDDLVAVPDIEETRSLTIDAPPSAIWPWLVQMGYGRAGWYSYDRIDMDEDSADVILEAHQQLAEGDLVPTHPGGGFEARVVQPEVALVLYLDSDLVGSEAAAAQSDEGGQAPEPEVTPPGLQMAGTLGDLAMPEFRGSWAFVLEPEADGSTRLIERFRIWSGDSAGLPQQLAMTFMGLGVFAMTRKHMLGLKERAERHVDAGASSATDSAE